MSRWNMKVARKIALGLAVALLAGEAATDDTLFASRAWAGPERAKPRLVRVVDLPDVPALHWRGGRYKDLGYLFGRDGTGTWVAYIGPGRYEPLTQRELEQMIRLIAEYDLPLKAPAAADAPRHGGAEVAGKESLMKAGTETLQKATAARDAGEAAASGRSALVRDELDRALLPQADMSLVTGSTTPAAEVMAGNGPLPQTPGDARLQRPAPGKMDGGMRKAPAAASGYMGLVPWLGLLAAGMAGVLWMLRRRRKAGQALRERMHHVMRQAPKGPDAMVRLADGDETDSQDPTPQRAAGHARPQRKADAAAARRTRHAKATPDEALRAMQAAARGGLAT